MFILLSSDGMIAVRIRNYGIRLLLLGGISCVYGRDFLVELRELLRRLMVEVLS